MSGKNKKILYAAAAALVIALVAPPFINVNRYRARLTQSMSEAMGRPVAVESISLRILPQPGFVLENLEVGDDARISAEPILRAEEVSAYLRLSSLWRGKLEIARLSLRYPSLNITRAADGAVNLESLLNSASHVEAAPTEGHADSRPRFPYISATNGRINFKNGLDKSAYILDNADFSLWSSGEGEWRMKIEATPKRTDMPLNDSGVIKAEASFKKAAQLRETPIEAHILWRKGQLGQITKLFLGADQGWRGGVALDLHLLGTPKDLHFSSDLSLDELHRYDIGSTEQLKFDAHCQGVGSTSTRSISGFECKAPVSDGTIVFNGAVNSFASDYKLYLQAANIPVNYFAVLARHSVAGLAPDLAAQGVINASVAFNRSGSEVEKREWIGSGSIKNLNLTASTLSKPFAIDELKFIVHTPTAPLPVVANVAKKAAPTQPIATPTQKIVVPTFLEFAPAVVDLGDGKATLGGSLATDSYSISLKGPATLERMQELSRTIGLPYAPFVITGKATADVSFSSKWSGDAASYGNGLGSLKLTSATANVPGIATPVQLTGGSIYFDPFGYRLADVATAVDKLRFKSNAFFPYSCKGVDNCQSELNLSFDELNVDALNTLLNPSLKKQPWYRFFNADKEVSAMAELAAHGKLTAAKLVLGTQTVSKASASFTLKNSVLSLTDLNADLLGGATHGTWVVDYSGKAPNFKGSGEFRKVNAALLQPLVKSNLGAGLIDADYKVSFSGQTREYFSTTARATLSLHWTKGSFKLFTAPRFPAAFSDFTAKLDYDERTTKITDGKLKTQAGEYAVSGSVGAQDQLNLTFTKGEEKHAVGGSLTKPEIASSGLPEGKNKR